MKKLIIILGILLAIPMVSYTVVEREKLLFKKSVDITHSEIQIRRIDGCEYIIVRYHEGLSVIHKANCPNHK